MLQVLVIYCCPALDQVIQSPPTILCVIVYGIVDTGLFLQPFRQLFFSFFMTCTSQKCLKFTLFVEQNFTSRRHFLQEA